MSRGPWKQCSGAQDKTKEEQKDVVRGTEGRVQQKKAALGASRPVIKRQP